MTTQLRYCIQFRPYAHKDSILHEYENIRLGLGASVVVNLVSKLPVMQVFNYHIVIDNYFTSPTLLRHLSAMGLAVKETVRANQMEIAPLQDMVKMNKEKRGSSDVANFVSSSITAVLWKGNKVVNTIPTFTGKQPIQYIKRYCHREKHRVNIEQPNIISQYNIFIRGVDRMDQNTSAYVINSRPKIWLWPSFLFVVDIAVNNAYQIYRQSDLNLQNIDWMPLAFTEPLLTHTIERVCHLKHYLKVVAAYITRKTICSLTVSITGLTKAHSDSAAQQDVMEPLYIIAKNAMSVFMLNVLDYITVKCT